MLRTQLLPLCEMEVSGGSEWREESHELTCFIRITLAAGLEIESKWEREAEGRLAGRICNNGAKR